MLDTRIVATLAALMIAAAAFVAGGPAADDARAAPCPKANAAPNEATSSQLGEAVLCLIGKERRQAGVKQLTQVGSLTSVAEKHTEVMIKKDCLQHRCEGEKSLNTRIVNSGYPIPGGRYAYAEVTGCSSTPQEMVDAWMDSRTHRKRLIGRAYRDVGIGPAKGDVDLARCDGKRGVYTVIFGWRKP